LKLAVPIHHLESVCVFGQSIVSPAALELCWEHGVPVNYFSENGYFVGRWEGVTNTSVMLRRAQYRAADSPNAAALLARQFVAGKLQNSRQSLLRSARETEKPEEERELRAAAAEIARLLQRLRDLIECGDSSPLSASSQEQSGNELPSKENLLDRIRGYEGKAPTSISRCSVFICASSVWIFRSRDARVGRHLMR
jgi:CRISPR-associated endonuclease Cas1